MIRIELDLPDVDQPGRWVYCSLDKRMLFQVEVGPGAGVRRFDVPVSRSIDEIALIINQFAEGADGGQFYGRVHGFTVLSLPLEGDIGAPSERAGSQFPVKRS